MEYKQDARPFVDLQKDAEEFMSKFEEDIASWKNVLNLKITSLISDPDSSGNLGNYVKNPLVEFSKAKYAIFISMKSLANDTEKEWIKYINQMKKLFLENVEIFLAGTKLEVKLPSSAPQTISGPSSSSLMPSSLYPIISNFTKKIPALSSPLRSKELQTSEPEETETMFSQRNRSNRSFEYKMDIDDAEMDLNTSQSSNRSRRSAKLNTSDLNASRDKGKSKETSEFNCHVLANEDVEFEKVVEVKQKSKLQSRGNKSKVAALNKKSKAKGIKKGSGSESQEDTSEFEAGMQVSNSESQEEEELESEKKSSQVIRGRGRQGRKPVIEKNTAVSIMSGQSSSEEDKLQQTEINSNVATVKGRRGKQALKSKEKENAVARMSEQSSSEENEKLKETEMNINVPAARGRRGKQAASKDKEKENVFKPENQFDEAVYEEEQVAPSVIPATRKGRSAASKSFGKPSDPILDTNTRRGRATTKEEGQATRVSRKPAGRRTLNERISESESSVSPVRVIFPVEEDINDDLDIYTPVARLTKSSARRKTLLPNLNEPPSVVEETEKVSLTRAKSKRKTISGVSDLASVAPSKRLKTSGSQMSNTVIEEEVAVGDNLLDSYSNWIVLKDLDGKIPTSPAIYEMKVWRAKKTAFIGSCESLRQMLTLHKLKQNSGNKHLDKYIDRNYNDIQVRYEVVPSISHAKTEVKNRINNFVAQHKTTPAYN